MAKRLKDAPITAQDLVEFLDSQSDFAFEVQTLKILVDLGFSCEHGGTYIDPVTEKPRAYDIRATRVFGNGFLRLAVEPKNLQANFPLLVSCLPRHLDESFHEVLYSVDPSTNPIDPPSVFLGLAMRRRSLSIRVEPPHSLYNEGESVGKACEQIGRTKNGEISKTDSGIYDKWAQALSSSDDLFSRACSEGEIGIRDNVLSLILPIVVVPNGTLWQTDYDINGKRIRNPHSVERCSYYVGREYYHPSPSGGDDLTLSHVEIVTSKGLVDLVDVICGDDKMSRALPWSLVEQELKARDSER